jgi:hypothetical protein
MGHRGSRILCLREVWSGMRLRGVRLEFGVGVGLLTYLGAEDGTAGSLTVQTEHLHGWLWADVYSCMLYPADYGGVDDRKPRNRLVNAALKSITSPVQAILTGLNVMWDKDISTFFLSQATVFCGLGWYPLHQAGNLQPPTRYLQLTTGFRAKT